MEHKRNKIAVYARVSTVDQSTELQKSELLDYLKARGWNDYVIYEDAGKTGTTDNRPALRKLLADAKVRKIDTILIWKLDRLFRSLRHLVITLQELQEAGVKFVSLKEQIDLGTASGRLLMQIIGAMAEFEGALIRERVRAGLKAAKARGKRLGRAPIIDQEKAVMLRQQGMSLSQVAKELGTTKSGVSKTLKRASLASRHVA